MSQPAEEEVDQYGRTIVRDRRFENNEPRHVDSDRQPADRNRDRQRSRSPPRYSRNYNDVPRSGGYRDTGGLYDDPYRRQSGDDYMRRGRSFDEPFYPAEHTDIPPAPALDLPRTTTGTHVTPLASFKSFMVNQTEDLPPEDFQRRYEKYNLDYLVYFSENFFNASKAEEWFQDRYNPINIVNTDKESAAWARGEAERFKASLLSRPEEMIAACSLEPNARRPTRKSLSGLSSGQPAKLELPGSTTTDTSGLNVAEDTPVELSGRHLPGHEQRTVYLSGVHACCPKKILRLAITAFLQGLASDEADGNHASSSLFDLTPERILISQPVWSNRHLERFERSAWVVLPNIRSAHFAAEKLQNLEISVPVKSSTGEVATAFSFKVQSTMHQPRVPSTQLPDYLSHSSRIQADIQRVELLIKLLDEDRDVAVENRLLKVLNEEEHVRNAVRKRSDHLDLLIAYLRRVHFVAFYAGKRFRDEAHMLLLAPSVVHRHAEYIPGDDKPDTPYSIPLSSNNGPAVYQATAAELLDASSSINTSAGQQSATVVSASSGAVVEEGEEDAANVAIVAGAEATSGVVTSASEIEGDSAMAVEDTNGATTTAIVKGANTTGVVVQNRFVPTADRKTDALLRELGQRVRMRRTQLDAEAAGASFLGLQDEIDAKKLEALQEVSFEKFAHTHSKLEANDKCRCLYRGCNKLFQNWGFLVKHMTLKHEGCADDILLVDAEPFLRRRFEEEDVSQRPLPPVEVEATGRIELKSVREILDKYAPASATSVAQNAGSGHRGSSHAYSHQQNHGGRFRDNNNRRNSRGDGRDYNPRHHGQDGGRRDSGGGHNNKRSRDDRDGNQNHAGGGNHNMSFQITREVSTGSTGGTAAAAAGSGFNPLAHRSMPRYHDVDAPKESAVSINYGAAIIPSVKRRKLSGKVVDPLSSPAPATSAAPASSDN